MKPKIAIAGASGFIGKWFIDKFHDQLDIVALSRKEHTNETRPGVKWKACDLYSLSSTIDALSGVDYALYLVHSMSPSTKLNQGSFEDTDLLLADNFARAAEECQLKQIVYIGGILPKENVKFSRHIQSRYEVENTLMGRSTPGHYPARGNHNRAWRLLLQHRSKTGATITGNGMPEMVPVTFTAY
jgi:uncharacterized protein YbjT (DUF2867 family)